MIRIADHIFKEIEYFFTCNQPKSVIVFVRICSMQEMQLFYLQ